MCAKSLEIVLESNSITTRMNRKFPKGHIYQRSHVQQTTSMWKGWHTFIIAASGSTQPYLSRRRAVKWSHKQFSI